MFCLNKTPTKGKFDVRSRRGIFIEYSGESKGFRIWLPDSRKVEVTRDVHFLEGRVEKSETLSEDFYLEDNMHDRSADCTKTPSIDVDLTFEKSDENEVVEEPAVAEDQGEIETPIRRRGLA